MFEFPHSEPSRESLTQDFVQHLSKEIETSSNNMMVFRTRIGFSLCIGPFLLLGSLIVSAKGQPVATNFRWYGWLSLGVVGVCYVGIAYIASEIELQALKQCDKWRTLIGKICKTPSTQIDETALKTDFLWRDRLFHRDWNGVTTAYRVGYLLLFIAVIAAVFIVRAGTPDPGQLLK